MPYEVRSPDLLARNPQNPIPVLAPEKSIGERAVELIHASLDQADRLLLEQRPRQAVQEILWLLETVSTAFQGIDTGTGTVAGRCSIANLLERGSQAWCVSRQRRYPGKEGYQRRAMSAKLMVPSNSAWIMSDVRFCTP